MTGTDVAIIFAVAGYFAIWPLTFWLIVRLRRGIHNAFFDGVGVWRWNPPDVTVAVLPIPLDQTILITRKRVDS